MHRAPGGLKAAQAHTSTPWPIPLKQQTSLRPLVSYVSFVNSVNLFDQSTNYYYFPELSLKNEECQKLSEDLQLALVQLDSSAKENECKTLELETLRNELERFILEKRQRKKTN